MIGVEVDSRQLIVESGNCGKEKDNAETRSTLRGAEAELVGGLLFFQRVGGTVADRV